MKKWQEFENEIANYLKKILRDYDLMIKQLGDADSTIPDIEILLNKNLKNFFLETKMPHSQTSQFALEIVDNKFIYSKKNKFKSNEFSRKFTNVKYSFFENKGRLFVKIPMILEHHECYINSKSLRNDKKYFLSKKSDNIYEVKITSGTNNPNVIFELSPKNQNNLDNFTIQKLIDYILNNEKDD